MSHTSGTKLRNSLLEVDDLFLQGNQNYLYRIFEKALRLRKAPKGPTPNFENMLGLMFFEASTRTKTSFELAARRIGVDTRTLDIATSSISKGESIEDTALTLRALGATAIVLRHSFVGACHRLQNFLDIPVINGGDGTQEHPTQAILDAFTIQQELGSIVGKKVLIVGDIRHSRVAKSNIKLLSRLGAKLTLCGPATLCPRVWEDVEVIPNFEEALAWADVCMLLRLQVERQSENEIPSMPEYSRRFGLTAARMKILKPTSIVLHPAPINKGIELKEEVLGDARVKIFKQVENGILIRAALLSEIMGVEI